MGGKKCAGCHIGLSPNALWLLHHRLVLQATAADHVSHRAEQETRTCSVTASRAWGLLILMLCLLLWSENNSNKMILGSMMDLFHSLEGKEQVKVIRLLDLSCGGTSHHKTNLPEAKVLLRKVTFSAGSKKMMGCRKIALAGVQACMVHRLSGRR